MNIGDMVLDGDRVGFVVQQHFCTHTDSAWDVFWLDTCSVTWAELDWWKRKCIVVSLKEENKMINSTGGMVSESES